MARSSASRPPPSSGDRRERPRRDVLEQARRRRRRRSSTVSVIRSCRAAASARDRSRERLAVARVDVIRDAALDARDRGQARSCARCRSPSTTTARSCRAAARRASACPRSRDVARALGPVLEQPSSSARSAASRAASSSTKCQNVAASRRRGALRGRGRCEEFRETERRGGRAAGQREEVGHRMVAGVKTNYTPTRSALLRPTRLLRANPSRSAPAKRRQASVMQDVVGRGCRSGHRTLGLEHPRARLVQQPLKFG